MTQPPPIPSRPPSSEASPARRLAAHAQLPGLAVVLAATAWASSAPGPAALLASPLAMGWTWFTVGRTPLKYACVSMAAGLLVAAFIAPLESVCWIGAAGLAGLVGAHLHLWRAGEDDVFFTLPALTLAGFVLGAWLVHGGDLSGFLGLAQEHLRDFRETALEQLAAQGEQEDGSARLVVEMMPWTLLGLWVLALWTAGRMARRRLGRLRIAQSSLILFHIRQRYIFLLIGGLVLEIVGSLPGREGLTYLSRLLLTPVVVAAFMQGLSVVLYFQAARRMQSEERGRAGQWISVAAVAMLFLFPTAGVFLGLADVWLDFRRLAMARSGSGG